jgi:hypothetical protein
MYDATRGFNESKMRHSRGLDNQSIAAAANVYGMDFCRVLLCFLFVFRMLDKLDMSF